MTAPLLERLRGLPFPAWALAFGMFVNRFGGFVIFFLVLYLTELGYSPARAGLAASAYGVGGLAAVLLGGQLADRVGRRTTIVVSMLASAGVMLVLSQARRPGLIIALAALAGTAAELYRPAAAAVMTDLTARGQRLTAFALYRTASNAGIAAGPAVAGLLAERSFDYVFFGDAATSLAFAAVALVALPGGRPPAARAGAAGPAGLWHALRTDASLRRILIGSVGAGFVLFQIVATVPLQVVDLGHSMATFGILASLNGLLVAALELPATSITGGRAPRPVIAAGFLLIGLGFGSLFLAGPLLVFVLAISLATLGEVAAMPVAAAFVADLSPDHLRGRYQSALGAAFAFAVVIAPAGGTALYQWSPDALWIACLAAGALAAGIVLRADPAPPAPSPEVA